MKKLFIMIALVMVALFCCSGCLGCGCGSCSGADTTVSFSNVWSNNKPSDIGLSETLTYNVKHEDNITIGKTQIKNSINHANFDFSYSNGKYVTTIKIIEANKKLLTDFAGNIVSSEILNDMVDSNNENAGIKIFYYHTRLDIDYTYTYKDKTETKKDFIETDTYFLLVENSLAPIYSKSEAKVTMTQVAKEIYVYQQHSQTTTVYNKKTLQTKVVSFHTENDTAKGEYAIGDIASQSTINSKYTHKSVVENNTLLFAFRTMNLAEGANALSVYSHIYGKPKTLNISKTGDFAEKFNVTLNGTAIPEEQIQLNGYSFVLNTSSGCSSGPNTGRPQYFFINKSSQTAPASIGSNRTIVMRYIEPLIEYSGYTSMGSLVYDLVSIEF